MNLGNQPVEVLIEDVYLLVVPTSENGYDAQEDERRVQAAKQERLENVELLHVRGQAEQATGKLLRSDRPLFLILSVCEDDAQQPQGLLSSLITKIVNNLQVTVKNIHIRYEDRLSVPGVSQYNSDVIQSIYILWTAPFRHRIDPSRIYGRIR